MQMDVLRVADTESMEPTWVRQGTAVLILLHRGFGQLLIASGVTCKLSGASLCSV